MRKKLAGIYLNAPLTESDIVNLGRNLDREIVINSTIVSDDVVDTNEVTNYITTFEYDSTLDGGTKHIRRSIPTLELLGNSDAELSGSHWIRIADGTYRILTSANRLQDTIEEIDEELFKRKILLHIIDAVGNGSLASSTDALNPSSTIDSGEYLIALGKLHSLTKATNSVILGGIESIIQGDNTSDSTYGHFGTIPVDVDGYTIQYAAIVGGYRNYIKGNSDYAGIFGGDKNEILDNSLHGLISGGAVNIICGYTDLSSIIGGVNSKIYGSIVDKKTRAGIFQSISSYIYDSMDSIIIGGIGSYIEDSSNSAAINNLGAYIFDSDSITAIGNRGLHIRYSYTSSIMSCLGPNSEPYYEYALYNTSSSSIIASDGSAIANSSRAIITSSSGCHINEFDPIELPKTTGTTVYTDSIEFTSIVGFYIGSLVYISQLVGIDRTTEYIISNISGTRVYFNTPNGIPVSFTATTDDCTICAISPYYTSMTVASNTSDTFIFSSTTSIPMSDRTFIVIDGLPVKRYKFETGASGTTHRLIDYDTKQLVTGLTPNAFIGNSARTTYQVYASASSSNSISASYGSSIYHAGTSSIISGWGDYIYNSGASAIIASGGSYIKDSSQSGVFGGGGNYIRETSHNSIILGGDHNYIEACGTLVGSGVYASASVMGSVNSYIHDSHVASIIGSIDSYIESCRGGSSDGGIGRGAFILGSAVSSVKNTMGSGIIGGWGNIIDGKFGAVIVGGYGITADNNNTTFVQRLNIWKNEISIGKGNSLQPPTVGDTLIVGSVAGDYAEVYWGAGGGGGDSYTYTGSIPSVIDEVANNSMFYTSGTTGSSTVQLTNTAPLNTTIYIGTFTVCFGDVIINYTNTGGSSVSWSSSNTGSSNLDQWVKCIRIGSGWAII